MDAKSTTTLFSYQCGSRTYKPNSVRLAAGRSFLWAAHYCAAQATYPEVVAHRAGTPPRKPEGLPGNPSLFGLAPCGVCPARRITAAAVRSYRTFSPLPEPCGPGGMFSVALSVERSRPYKRGGPPGRYPAHCSAEFGLSSRLATSDRPVRLPTASL